MSEKTRKLPDHTWITYADEKKKEVLFFMIGHAMSELGEAFSALQDDDIYQVLDEIKDAENAVRIIRNYLIYGESNKELK